MELFLNDKEILFIKSLRIKNILHCGKIEHTFWFSVIP